MAPSTIPHPPVVSREQWLVARKNLLTREKELTKQRDRINAERRGLPMVKIPEFIGCANPQARARRRKRTPAHCELRS